MTRDFSGTICPSPIANNKVMGINICFGKLTIFGSNMFRPLDVDADGEREREPENHNQNNTSPYFSYTGTAGLSLGDAELLSSDRFKIKF